MNYIIPDAKNDVQLCEVCGWWCEISEMDEYDDMDMVCEQCRGEE